MMFMDAYDSYRAGDLETALLKYYYLAELGYEVAQSNVAYVLEKGNLPLIFIYVLLTFIITKCYDSNRPGHLLNCRI